MSLISASRDCQFHDGRMMRGAAWIALMALWNVGFIAPLCGPVMHESDQASLLEGAVVISQNGDLVGQGFYNYDKQFGSYWLVASALKLLGGQPNPNDVVMLGNAVSVVLFNAGLVLLVFSLASWASVLFLGCLLFAPTFIIHPPFLAGNYLSAFFIFAQFIALRKSSSIVLPLLCAFCATACRADALLAQPVLLWSTTHARTLTGWMRDMKLWACVVAAGGALLLGSALTSDGGAESSNPSALFLNGKVLAVYSVFGLGAGIGILVFSIVALREEGCPRIGSLFGLAGLLSLLLPFAYYAANMSSTRHWTVALVALMCFVASARGEQLISKTVFASRLRSAFLILLVLSAVLPLFFGLRLSAHGLPLLTMSRPTLVPSADGLIPLGSYLSYSWGWDRTDRRIPDHNQATWLAALAADFESSKGSPLRILVSPLVSIVRLAVRLRGFDYQLTENLQGRTETYAEFRALRKAATSHSRGRLHDLLPSSPSHGVEFASPLVAGEAIVRLTPTRNPLAESLQKLHEAFGGNDYHFLKPGAVSFGDAEPGHLMVLVSQTPFRVKLGHETLMANKNTMVKGKDCYLLKFIVGNSRAFTLEGTVEIAALSVLPASMSVEAY
jgi:hypothetical protein